MFMMDLFNFMVVFVSLSMMSIIPSNASPQGYGSGLFQTYTAEDCERNCATVSFNYPICASNGRTYVNDGLLSCVSKCHNSYIYKVHDGQCQQRTIIKAPPPSNPSPDTLGNCECFASYSYNPVCGSDGQTYTNYDKMKCDNHCYGKNVYISHLGECRGTGSGTGVTFSRYH